VPHVAAKRQRQAIQPPQPLWRGSLNLAVNWCFKPKLTAHQRKEAIARREAGETLVDIARSYNVSHPTYDLRKHVTDDAFESRR
jgi:hypothetical protein